MKPQVIKILDRHNWFHWGTTAGFGKSGISDRIAYKDHVLIAIETKFDGNKATALQIGFLNSISAEGGFGFIVDEHTLTNLDSFLEKFAQSAAYAAEKKRVPLDLEKALIDDFAVLTDYPKSLENYAAWRARTKKVKTHELKDTDDPDVDHPERG